VKVSVIVPTRNRAGILARCLEALIRQRFDADQFEVIVVDDASTDQTPQLVRVVASRSRPRIRLIVLGARSGPAAARNAGLLVAESQIVVFIGDDIIVQPDFLSEHLRGHSLFPGSNIAVLGFTKYHPEIETTPLLVWLEDSGIQFNYAQVKARGPSWREFYTSNISLKRNFLLENGLFDEDFKEAAWEDIELGFRLWQRGLRIRYCRQAVGYHLHPSISAQEFFKGTMFKRGRFEVLLQSKHRRIREFYDRDTLYWSQLLASVSAPPSALSRLWGAVEGQPGPRMSVPRWAKPFGSNPFDALATFYSRLGALAELMKGRPALEKAACYFLAAREAERKGDLTEAARRMADMPRIEPELFGLRFVAASFFAEHDMPSAAKRQYRAVLAVDGRHAYANLFLAELLLREGSGISRARRGYETALAGRMLDPGSEALALIGLGRIAIARKRRDWSGQASRYLEAAVVMSEAREQANRAAVLLAEVCLETGQLQRARLALSNVKTTGGEDRAFLSKLGYLRGLVDFRSGRYSDALLNLNEAARLAGRGTLERAWAQLHAAICLSLMGKQEAALRILGRLERVKGLPDEVAAQIDYHAGSILLSVGRSKAAANRFRAAIARLPVGHPVAKNAMLSLADALSNQGEYGEALGLVRELVSALGKGDLAAEARLRIGRILADQGQHVAAAGQFVRAAQSRATDKNLLAQAWLNAGFCHKKEGQLAQARLCLARARRAATDGDLIARAVWEAVLLAGGDRGQADAADRFARAVRRLRRPARIHADALCEAALLLGRMGEHERSAGLLKRFAGLIEGKVKVAHLLIAYGKLGLVDEAEALMSSLEFLPRAEQAEWHLSAAMLLMQMGYDHDAEDELRSALRLRPHWTQANYVLASLLERRRKFDEARARFEAVVEYGSEIPQRSREKMVAGAHYHLGCILSETGMKDEAVQHLEACLELMPKHKKAKQLMRSLVGEAAVVG